ncbi:hypothetical protein V2G26_014955 [Clonostachys chloroleuca]
MSTTMAGPSADTVLLTPQHTLTRYLGHGDDNDICNQVPFDLVCDLLFCKFKACLKIAYSLSLSIMFPEPLQSTAHHTVPNARQRTLHLIPKCLQNQHHQHPSNFLCTAQRIHLWLSVEMSKLFVGAIAV